MSILTGFKKVKNYILTSSGYQLLSRWTSSQTVEFDDGKTAQAKLGEINGIAKTYVDMKKATDNSMAASARAVMEGLENSSALISMTQAEYDALSDEERTDNNMRAILDANPDVVDAKNVNFDNTDTNLTSTNTQSAITELNGKLNWFDIKNVYGEYTAVGSNNSAEICRLSLTPGTWLLLGYIDNSMSKDTIYNNSIFRESLSHHCQTVRSTLIGGGGSVNSYAITVQTNMDILLGTYDNSDIKGNIFRGTLLAIRLLKL